MAKVAGLPAGATAEELTAAFAGCGAVEKATVVPAKGFGSPRAVKPFTSRPCSFVWRTAGEIYRGGAICERFHRPRPRFGVLLFAAAAGAAAALALDGTPLRRGLPRVVTHLHIAQPLYISPAVRNKQGRCVHDFVAAILHCDSY